MRSWRRWKSAYEKDWMTCKVSALLTSGDRDLDDGQRDGFDAIVPNQQFAGGGFLGNPALADRGLINNAFAAGGTNFLNRQPIPLTGTGVLLFGAEQPDARPCAPGLFEGQANFINPGILLFNAGLDAKITPKLRATLNVNWARFTAPKFWRRVLFQSAYPPRHRSRHRVRRAIPPAAERQHRDHRAASAR